MGPRTSESTLMGCGVVGRCHWRSRDLRTLGLVASPLGHSSPAFYMEPHIFCRKETETSKVAEKSSSHSV